MTLARPPKGRNTHRFAGRLSGLDASWGAAAAIVITGLTMPRTPLRRRQSGSLLQVLLACSSTG